MHFKPPPRGEVGALSRAGWGLSRITPTRHSGESRNPVAACTALVFWIPAYAGMTGSTLAQKRARERLIAGHCQGGQS
jgi:hypothetical protein